MVDYVSDANELVRRFRAYAFSDDAPADIAEKLQTIPGVAADVICTGAEMLYAHRDLLDDNGLRVMAELYNYAVQHKWEGFNESAGSQAIVNAAAKALGDATGKASDPDKWPEPKAALRADRVDWRFPDGKPEPAVDPDAPPGNQVGGNGGNAPAGK